MLRQCYWVVFVRRHRSLLWPVARCFLPQHSTATSWPIAHPLTEPHPPAHPPTHQPASHPLPPWGFWNAHMFQSSMTSRTNDWIDDWMYEAMVDSTSCRWWLHHASAMVLGCGCLSESILDVFCAHMFQPIRNESLLSHHLWLFDVRIPTSGKVKKDTSA